MEKIELLLVGNPNTGKSTLFNRLCGMRRKTGNYAGVSVDSKTGYFRDGGLIYSVTDLPGAYSLNPTSEDEMVTTQYLQKNKGIIVNVIDASCLERSLILTKELLALERPMIIVLNMADEMKKRGIKIDIPRLERLLGTSVIETTATRGKGMLELAKVARKADKSSVKDIDISAVAETVIEHTQNSGVSSVIDNIFLRPLYGLPLSALLLMLVFYITFGDFGIILKESLWRFLSFGVRMPLDNFLRLSGASPILCDFLIDGLLAGVFSVLSFLPQIILLFFFLYLLEDIGFMARIAFLADPCLRRFGLSGRAIIPMAIGFGCTLPAIMSARIVNSRARRSLYLVLPFVSCPARAPVYALFISSCFGGRGVLIIFFIYALGILVALICAKFIQKLDDKKADMPFVMELPPYRMPSASKIFLMVYDKCLGFILKAGSVIVIASAAIWLTQNIHIANGDSLLHFIGLWLAPLFKPLGFGNAISASSLIMGFFAKESIVSSLEVLYGGGISLTQSISAVFSRSQAISFMVFSLLYTPCAATLGAIKKESGSAIVALKVVGFDFLVAYAVTFVIYNLAKLIF